MLVFEFGHVTTFFSHAVMVSTCIRLSLQCNLELVQMSHVKQQKRLLMYTKIKEISNPYDA